MTTDAASDRTAPAAPASAAPVFELLPAGSVEETRLIREFADHATVGFSLYELPQAPGEPGRFRFVNRAYLKLLGMPTELTLSEVGDAVLDVLHPDDRSLTDTVVADLQAGRSTAVVLRMIRPDGAVRWVRSRRSPVLDSDGRLARIVGTAEDVTDLETAAAALADSQEQFHQLADNVAVGFTLTELSDPPRMVYWNSAFLQILGVDPARGMPPVDQLLATHLHPDDLRKWAAGLAAIRAGETLDDEVRILRSDGQLRWLRVRRSPVRNADGVVFRAAGTTEDVTDRKTAESALRFAQSEADRANAAKNEFLSRMSHELRTPLNAVLGFAQLLEMDRLTESQADAVGYILRGGRHLLALINDVLDIAGIEADRLELSIEPVHVGSAMSEALSMVRAQARDAGVELHLDDAGPAVSGFVRADQRRLRQVLINLLSNAIKYNRRGGWVRLSAEETGNSQVRLVVADSGIGIRSEDMDRLFVPFDRIGQQVSGIEGSGIGLALSQRLVAFMGGHFDSRSEFGHRQHLRRHASALRAGRAADRGGRRRPRDRRTSGARLDAAVHRGQPLQSPAAAADPAAPAALEAGAHRQWPAGTGARPGVRSDADHARPAPAGHQWRRGAASPAPGARHGRAAAGGRQRRRQPGPGQPAAGSRSGRVRHQATGRAPRAAAPRPLPAAAAGLGAATRDVVRECVTVPTIDYNQ